VRPRDVEAPFLRIVETTVSLNDRRVTERALEVSSLMLPPVRSGDKAFCGIG
jgi:hypothetical protein